MIQIWAVRTEQGFEYRQYGASDRTILDYGGLALVTTYKPLKSKLKPPAGKTTPGSRDGES